MASCPSDIDFSWGLKLSLSAGTRSRTRRVVWASCSSSCRSASIILICISPSVGLSLGFGLLARALQNVRPTLPQALPVVVRDEPERRVAEGDERAALHFLQAVLNVRDDREREEERPADLEELPPLDGL